MITRQGIENVARNINRMDVTYHYSDDMSVWKFWNGLNRKLRKILSGLGEEQKKAIKELCNESKAEYFGLV